MLIADHELDTPPPDRKVHNLLIKCLLILLVEIMEPPSKLLPFLSHLFCWQRIRLTVLDLSYPRKNWEERQSKSKFHVGSFQDCLYLKASAPMIAATLVGIVMVSTDICDLPEAIG
ncbi:hypothetical protein NPIL_687321 [Nephila pilipes]|uniref:Uncharacterized protein n=1 Tax=Nephila pilipes TaxID=299642 RepID=A0A8X6Q1V9_NEPPI|nr:hypothetical protein NPIL_687321 [Nephila pilipes]